MYDIHVIKIVNFMKTFQQHATYAFYDRIYEMNIVKNVFSLYY